MSRFTDSEVGFDCGKCKKVPGLQDQRGCFKPGRMEWTIDDEQVRQCPQSIVLQDPDYKDYHGILSFYSLKQKGLLPYPVGYMEHPAAAIDLVECVEAESNRLDKLEMENARKQSKRARRG